MKLEKKVFGTTRDGQEVLAYTLSNDNGMQVTVLNYGCVIQSLIVPDRYGRPVDVVLGYDTIEEYEDHDGYFGAFIGRVGNRIGKGQITLDGQDYQLFINDRGNHLHGGACGFNRKVYETRRVGDELVMTRMSPDGEEQYPGNLRVTVRYRISSENTLHISYSGVSDKDTLFNPTNHSYFNLNGGGTILSHELQVLADRFCENDAQCLPTGKLCEVEGTPFDFQEPKAIGRDIGMQCSQLEAGNGYDHNFCLSDPNEWKVAARLLCNESGIAMTCKTTMPGVQVYTGNGTSPRQGKHGPIGRREAVCLETQFWPDAIHHDNFPSAVLKAGEVFLSQTAYHFDVL